MTTTTEALRARLLAHAAIHEADMAHDDEQQQWAADLREAAAALSAIDTATAAAPSVEPVAPDWLLRSKVADLLHLLEFSAISTATGSDDVHARRAMADLKRILHATPQAQPAAVHRADAAEVECYALSAWHLYWRSLYMTEGYDEVPPQFLAAFRAGYAAAERAAGITPQEGA